MTTIKELKAWLEQFPEDAEVEFAVQQEASEWQSYGAVDFVEPDLKNEYTGGWEYVDFTNNQFVTPDKSYFGKKFLRLGESC